MSIIIFQLRNDPRQHRLRRQCRCPKCIHRHSIPFSLPLRARTSMVGTAGPARALLVFRTFACFWKASSRLGTHRSRFLHLGKEIRFVFRPDRWERAGRAIRCSAATAARAVASVAPITAAAIFTTTPSTRPSAGVLFHPRRGSSRR